MGNRIKEIRKSKDMTLLQLSELLGVSESTVQRYESGNIKNLKYETIVALAELFGCTPGYLMGWDSDDGHYNDGETLELAKKLFENEELHALFKAAEDADPEDLEAVHNMLLALKRKERH